MTRKGEARSVAQRLVVRLLDHSNVDHWLFRNPPTDPLENLAPLDLNASWSTSSRPHVLTSSRPHVLTSSRPHVLTSSRPHVLASFGSRISVVGDGHAKVVNFEGERVMQGVAGLESMSRSATHPLCPLPPSPRQNPTDFPRTVQKLRRNTRQRPSP